MLINIEQSAAQLINTYWLVSTSHLQSMMYFSCNLYYVFWHSFMNAEPEGDFRTRIWFIPGLLLPGEISQCNISFVFLLRLSIKIRGSRYFCDQTGFKWEISAGALLYSVLDTYANNVGKLWGSAKTGYIWIYTHFQNDLGSSKRPSIPTSLKRTKSGSPL